VRLICNAVTVHARVLSEGASLAPTTEICPDCLRPGPYLRHARPKKNDAGVVGCQWRARGHWHDRPPRGQNAADAGRT
jgi:hypothetical protein